MRNIFFIIIILILFKQSAFSQNNDLRQRPTERSIVKQNEINAALQSLRPNDSIIVNQNSLGEQLKRKLVGKTKLKDIMFVVDSFYNVDVNRKNGGDGLLRYKQWKRWEYMMSKQVNPDGSFVNSAELIMRADEEETRKNNGNNRSQLPGSWNNIGTKKSEYSSNTGNSYANGVGRVDRIAFHPSNSNIIYVGTPYGGLWKTIDGGSNWQCMTDTLPALGISGIVIDKNNPDFIYILTGTGDNTANSFVTIHEYAQPSIGVMKSLDGGVTWTLQSLPATPNQNYIGYDLVQNPVYASELMAATSDGVFLTLNSGTSWTKVRNGNHFDVEYKPNDSDRAYCSTNNAIFYSADFGQTWTQATATSSIPSNTDRIAIAVTPINNNEVYILCGKAAGIGAFNGVYKSTDSGVNYTLQSNTPNILGYETNGQDNTDQAGYDLCIAASPTVSNRVVFSSINVWATTNGGASITNQTKWYETYNAPNSVYVHPDHHALAYNPLDQKLYACNDGGISVSTNHGDTWTNKTEGLIISQYYHMAQFKTNSYVLAFGLQDNGAKIRDKGSKDHIHLYGADGFSTAFQNNNPIVVYATINDGGLKVNANTGASITPFTMPDQGGNYFKHIMTHPTDTNTVYVGNGSNLFTSTNGGASWSSNSNVSGYWAMDISQSNPQRMYIAGGPNFTGTGGLWTTSNGGTSWTTLTSNAGFPTSFNRITDIAINPSNPNEVYVSVGGFTNGSKVFYSNNSGATWGNYSFNLPNVVVHSIKVASAKVYAGTDLGLYVRNFGSTTWTSIRDNMPKTPVSEIFVDESTGNIICATFGRGVWQRDFCVNDITLNGKLKGRLDYNASNMITAQAIVTGMNNVDSILLNANNKILLTPGFHAKTGTYMKTSQLPCDNGSQPLTRRKDGDIDKVEEVNAINNRKKSK